MSLVFYWPISFKSPTPFSGHTECLMVPKKKKPERAAESVCWTRWSGVTPASPYLLMYVMELDYLLVMLAQPVCFALPSTGWAACLSDYHVGFFFLLRVCACVCVCVSECWICALLWRTGKEGWGANLFLCRLTLSFQTPLFSKTPTISSVCLPPPPPPPHPSPPSSLPPASPLLLPYTLPVSLSIRLPAWALVYLCGRAMNL